MQSKGGLNLEGSDELGCVGASCLPDFLRLFSHIYKVER